MENKNRIYQKAFALAEKYLISDPSHGLDHIKRVLQLVDYIVIKEKTQKKIDSECLRLATVLHDLGSQYQVRKLRSSRDKFKSGLHLGVI